MSLSYVYSFLLGTVVLYALNPPLPDNGSFVKVSEKNVLSPMVKNRLSLGADPLRAGKVRRKILFKNSPFKKTYERRRKALQSQMSEFYKIRPVRSRRSFQKRYVESVRYDNDDLVIGIKSELFRLGCFRGKINTVWNAEVREELERLNRGLSSRYAEDSTLRYLKRQKTLGCIGNRVWDRLVFGTPKKVLTNVAEVQMPEFEDEYQAEKDASFSKKQADKKIAAMFVKSQKKKYVSKRRKRRVARKKFGFNDMFGINAL